MSNEETKEQEKMLDTNNKKEFNKKIFIKLGIIVILIYSLYIYILSRPLKDNDLNCVYKGKFNKIVCIQTKDVVPQWLQIDDNPYLKYLGINDRYSMKLIISHDNKNYRVLNMTDKEFIVNMNRKFIYELEEQSFRDWIDFKKFALLSEISNWGSVVLYCSDDNLKDDICKQMKKRYK